MVPGRQRTNARNLRRTMTEPERKLWWGLRYSLPVDHSHFRRQVPIGPYITDFCCHRAKLVIEVDGNQHGTDYARTHDVRRTLAIEAEGYRVLRFSNEEVWRSFDSVLDTVFAVVAERTPTPDPSPQGGGESGGVA